MNEYEIDIKVEGHMRMHVVAKSEDEAHDKATDVFSDQGLRQPIGDLRWKKIEPSTVDIIDCLEPSIAASKDWGELVKAVSCAEGCLQDVYEQLDADDPLRRLLEGVSGVTGHIYGELCDRANKKEV